jgi:parvulin-like peptidyl-prolyl isomerase
MAELQEISGSAENFAAWLQENQWTEEEFRKAITAELLTQKMIETVTANVPTSAEQIRARYIRVDDQELAQTLLDQINTGADFAELARQYSLDTLSAQGGGDMGFFSAGTLLVPELDAAAFTLQPGQTSQVIPVTNFDGSPTYYILQVTERVAQRPLEGNQRATLLEQTIASWLEGLRTQAEITIFVDTSAE